MPSDLERLRNLGFRDFLIFKLMREACEHAKRLSDVVDASWEHLRHTSHPISYLRALLRKPVDFAYRARTQRASEQAATDQRRKHDSIERMRPELAGKSFVNQDGTHEYSITADGASVEVRQHDEPQPRTHAGDWITGFVAALRAGHIIPTRDAQHGRATRADLHKRPSTPTRNFSELRQLLRQSNFAAIRLPT